MNNNNISQNTATHKKQKRKFNIIDFFIIVIILVVVAVLIYAVAPWAQLNKLWSTDEVTFNYAVEFRGVDAKFISLIKDGDAVINSVSKNSLGKVNSIENPSKSQTLDYKMDDSGMPQGVLVDNSDKYDITVHITATAQYEEGVGYTVNGCRVAVGEEICFRFPTYEKIGYCVAIDTK